MLSGNDQLATGYMIGRDGGGNYGNCGNGMWGDNWWGIILFAMIFGWGNNGWGNGFGGGYYNNAGTQFTEGALQRGFDTQTIVSKLDGISNGICDSTFALNNTIVNGFNGVNNAVCNLGYQNAQLINGVNMNLTQGFHGVDNAICNLGYQTQAGQNAIQTQLAQCCCDIRSGQKDALYQMATDTCAIQNTIQNTTRDIIDNQNNNYRSLMDWMVQRDLSNLQMENQNLKLAASQSQQNNVLMAAMEANKAEILRRTGNDCPVAAYVVPNPNCCYGNPMGVDYNGYNNGCCRNNYCA